MIKKRGVSTVVATVLILFVTIASVGIVARFVVPFVEDNLEKGSECLDYRRYFQIYEEFGFTCSQKTGTLSSAPVLYGISIKADGKDGLDDNLKGINVVMKRRDRGDSEIFEIIAGEKNDYENVGGVMMFGDWVSTELVIPKRGEIMTYVINAGTEIYSELEIYPILKNGRVCEERNDYIKIAPCGTGVNLE